MPIYSYKCEKCNRVIDTYRHVEDRVFPEICECGGFAQRSFKDEAPVPRIFEPYFDMHLANDDYPNGRMCTGFKQKEEMMKEMNLTYYPNPTPDPPSKRAMWAQRNRVSLKKHFTGINEKLKHRNSA